MLHHLGITIDLVRGGVLQQCLLLDKPVNDDLARLGDALCRQALRQSLCHEVDLMDRDLAVVDFRHGLAGL